MSTATQTNGGLTLTAYTGDGNVLLAYSLDSSLLKANQLAGFSIQFTPPGGTPTYLLNRLNYNQPVTAKTPLAQAPWTSSQQAPFQKFHWVHFPTNVVPGKFTYKVTARYCQGSGLVDGPSAEVNIDLVSAQTGDFELGLTRGYISSQAYATKFKNAPIRPTPKTQNYNTAPYQAQYAWLGAHARAMIFTLLKACVADPTIEVDLFAYDLDEPDIIAMLVQLKGRLRAFLDNASLHTGKALEVTAHARLVASAGAANVKQGHFQRYAHDKIIIVKKAGKAIKVLTGSANFSVRGLYVQANNVLLFNDADIADQYEQVFDSVFKNMAGFVKGPLAAKWFPFAGKAGIPNFEVSFAPHKKPPFSMVTVQQALASAKSSVMFAVMELSGSGAVLNTLQTMHLSGKVFSYGMTQNDKGFTLYKPGQPGVLVPFATLKKQVPPPFQAEFDGGPGQTIHDKFIVIDFNDANPIVYTGSSNLADGGEASNGDNLLQISDPAVAQVFAAEAIRLVDHYYFRAAVRSATTVKPLVLSPCGSNASPWWTRDYDPNNMRNVQRELFAQGPSAVKTIPKGVSDPQPQAPAKKTAKKKAAAKKSTRARPAAKKAPAKKAAKRKSSTAASKKRAVTGRKSVAAKKRTAKKAPKKAAPRKKR